MAGGNAALLQHQLDQRIGARLLVKGAAGFDDLLVLRLRNRQPGNDAAYAARFFFEVPDELAAGALQRVAFAESAGQGSTVVESDPAGAAAGEINQLVEEILSTATHEDSHEQKSELRRQTV